MWRTNVVVDKMKKIAILSLACQDSREGDIYEKILERVNFSLMLENYEPYAFFFSQKLSLPGVLTTVLPGLIAQFYPLISS